MLSPEQLLHLARRDLRKAERAYTYCYARPNCPEREQQDLLNNVEYRRFQLRLAEAYVTAYDKKNKLKEVVNE